MKTTLVVSLLHTSLFATMRRLGRSALLFLIAVSTFAFAGAASAAEPYPSRAMRLVIPFPAGGPADIVGRLYAQHLSQIMGQSVVVENLAGASGSIGTRVVAQAPADGYSLLFGTTSTMAINPLIMKDLPYNFERDFTLIGMIANAPHVLAVRAGLPAKSVSELIDLAKKEPGKYTFASAGMGTIIQMGGELFKLRSGTDILHVPYKGGNPATLALLGGDVDMTVNDMTTLKAYVADGRLRALAVANPTRLALLPDTPTFAEAGLNDMVSSTWWGVSVASKTPEAIQSALKQAHTKIIRNPAYIDRLASMAVETLDITPEQSQSFIEKDIAKWQEVVTAADIRAD